MGFGETEDIGVAQCSMQAFKDALTMRLSFMSGIIDASQKKGLTLKEMRKPLLVIGDPGIGKTEGIAAVINDVNTILKGLGKDIEYKLKVLPLASTIVGEISGIEVVNPATGKCVRSMSSYLPDPEIDGEYGVLFMDEITTADTSQLDPALGLTDGRRGIGSIYKLPEHWLVVAAGNGPNCANFVELKDMTETRFEAFDISFNFKEDWEAWAMNNNINPMIIAFLNFDPSHACKVVSNDDDKCGKMFATPRTWTSLSSILDMRELYGKPVTAQEIYGVASRSIGKESAKAFSAFYAFKNKLDFDPDKIIAGTEKKPTSSMRQEAFEIILHSLVTKLIEVAERGSDGMGNYDEEVYAKCGNVMNWLLAYQNIGLDNVVNGIVKLIYKIDGFRDIFLDPDFAIFSPELGKFLQVYGDTIIKIQGGK